MRPSSAFSLLFGLLIALPAFGQDARSQRADRQQSSQFRQIFYPRGIEFSEEQTARIAELRREYEPQLIDIQRKSGEVISADQRRVRQEAFQAARDAGKEGRELREIAEAALKLTDEQKRRITDIEGERRTLLGKVQSEVRKVLTDEQREQLQRDRRRGAGERNPSVQAQVVPTHRDLKYGPHRRNVMDVWLAESDQPTPVLVSIHGGGFRGGNKSIAGDMLRECLASGISVVAITYRLSNEAIAPAQFLDSARAIQFIRHNAEAWHLDPTRIAATGGSAGAGISLWLGFHDDMADPDNEDPVLRQSTRLTCMAVYNGQTSYDPRFIRELFPDTTTYKESALAQLFDVDLDKLDELPEEKYKLFEEVSALPHLTKDDAPAALFYASKMETPITSQGIGIHHPRFGKALKEKMDEFGIECHVHTDMPRSGEWARDTMDFVKKHLGVE